MTKRHLGQHFLYDPSILNRIIEVAELQQEDLVIEIGPGHGRLSKLIAEKVKKLIAIELDENLYEKLNTELSEYKNLELIHGDALKYPFENHPEFKVVANIPYYITTPIIFRLLDTKQNIKSITITVQKEIAERIIAKPGKKDYGVLSIAVQYHTQPSLKFIIPKGAFRPAPKVDSAVIHMKILNKPSVLVTDERMFFKIVKTAFSQRRKMLSNSLKIISSDVKTWLNKTGIDPKRRPETLSIEEFAELANTI
jgi:16S rRNA (adenine1518-N6/adenine1519-N6)-dimethyltransferase